jgi:hypothetical protein
MPLDGSQVINIFCWVRNFFYDSKIIDFISLARKPFRTFNGRITCVLGLTGGVLYGIMRSTQRLAGLEANDAEVARYGSIPSALLAETEQRRDIRNLNLIDTEAIDIAKRAEK